MGSRIVTWNGDPEVVCNNDTKESDEIIVESAVSVTIGLKTSDDEGSAVFKVFVQLAKGGIWYFANTITNAELLCEGTGKGKTASTTLIGAVRAFKLVATTTKNETISAMSYMQIGKLG